MGLNTPMKIVLAVVIIFLIGIGFYLLDYQKKITQIKQLENTLQTKKDQLKADEERVKRLPEELKKRERLRAELNALIQKQLPEEDPAIFVPMFIKEIETLVASERAVIKDPTFKILSLAPGPLQIPGGDEGGKDEPKISALQKFPRQLFNVQLTGKYYTCMHFLHQLALLRLKRLVTINKINLAPAEATIYGKSPMLNIVIPMTAYLKEKSAPTPAGGDAPVTP